MSPTTPPAVRSSSTIRCRKAPAEAGRYAPGRELQRTPTWPCTQVIGSVQSSYWTYGSAVRHDPSQPPQRTPPAKQTASRRELSTFRQPWEGHVNEGQQA